MAALMPQGKQQFFTAGGIPLVGGKVYTYAAGTTTPLATYTTAAADTPNANPVILDSRGEASIFFSAANYKIVAKDSLDSTIWTQDNLPGDLAGSLAASTGSSLVGHIASGAGAVATTVQEVNRRVIHLLDFKNAAAIAGDWTTGFQAAIDYAQLTYARLELFAGEINITDELIISQTNGLSIRGAGQNATIIRISAAGKCGFKGGAAVSPGPAEDRNKVTFEDFTLVGSAAGNPYTVTGTFGTTSHGIAMTNWHHYELHRVGIWFFGGDGLHLVESYIGTTDHCHIAGNAGWGVYAAISASGVGYSNHATTITNSEVQGNKTGGIYVDGSSSFNILNNTIEANTSVGIDLVYASGFTITGNYFETNGAYHIRVGNALSSAGPALGGVISGNHLENASTAGVTAGIYLNNTYAVNVLGNYAFNTVKIVILSANATNCFIGPNHSIDGVTNSSTTSVFISGGGIIVSTFDFPSNNIAWTPVATSLGGTGITYDAVYSKVGAVVNCFIRISGTTLTATGDTTSLTLPSTSARVSVGVVCSGGSVTTGAFCLVSGGSVILPTIAATSRIDLTFSYQVA